MKSRSLHNSTKKGFMIFLSWRYGHSWSTINPLVFRHATSRKTLRPARHPAPVRDVIIEQPLCSHTLMVKIQILQNTQSAKIVQPTKSIQYMKNIQPIKGTFKLSRTFKSSTARNFKECHPFYFKFAKKSIF